MQEKIVSKISTKMKDTTNVIYQQIINANLFRNYLQIKDSTN